MSIYGKLLVRAIASAIERQSRRPTVSEQMQKIRLGMRADEVTALIGKPDKIIRSQRENKVQDQWAYSSTTVISNVRGIAAAVGFAFTQGFGDKHDQELLLCFENGMLADVKGLPGPEGLAPSPEAPSPP